MTVAVRVFVYGTLKPGERGYHLCAGEVIAARPAIALGELYALPFGYPAMTPGTRPVYGFLLSFRQSHILSVLDLYEQHDSTTFHHYAPTQVIDQNQYSRRQIELLDNEHSPIGSAWAYLMSVSQVQRLGGVLLPDGRWQQAN